MQLEDITPVPVYEPEPEEIFEKPLPIPEEVLKQEVLSYDLEDTVFRIWVNGDGIPHTIYP